MHRLQSVARLAHHNQVVILIVAACYPVDDMTAAPAPGTMTPAQIDAAYLADALVPLPDALTYKRPRLWP